jgi:hypothetical protein
MTEPGQANVIFRDSLLQLMRDHSEVALRAGEQLSAVYYTAHEEVRTLGLTTHQTERLAKLLLSWITKARERSGGDNSRPVKTDSQPRRDWRDHRGYPPNRYSSSLRVQQAADTAAKKIGSMDPRPACAGRD